MAYSTAAFTTAEAAALANDKPMLVTPNRFVAGHLAEWRTSGAWASGSDSVESGYPVSRMRDDFTHQRSRPTAAFTDSYLVFDFGAAGIEFDTIAILNHNIPAASTVLLGVSDATNFSPVLVAATTSATVLGRRIVFPLSARYSAVRYARIRIVPAASTKVEIGEVIFGKRVQLDWAPDVSYDPQALLSPGARETRTITGISHTTNLGPKSQRRIRAMNSGIDATVYANLLAWWKEHGGTRPFLWIENPNTAPHRANLVKLDEPSFEAPYVDGPIREWMLEATEVGPHFTALEP
jgi:hypothetical protein